MPKRKLHPGLWRVALRGFAFNIETYPSGPASGTPIPRLPAPTSPRLSFVRHVVVAVVVLVCASSFARAEAGAAPQMRPGQIRVLVLNGTHRAGLAARVTATLAKQRFRVQQLARPWVANAPARVTVTTVYFDSRQPKARAAAAVMRDLFGPRTAVRPSTRSIGRLADHAGRPLLIVVLGSAFRGVT
jgi:hypothetical protein